MNLLRERFGIEERNSAIASRIIKEEFLIIRSTRKIKVGRYDVTEAKWSN